MKLKPGELGATLFELAPCAVVVVDRDYNIIAANPAFRESYGDWEGSHCYEVFKRQHRPCGRCAALDTFRDGEVHVTEEHGFNKEGKRTYFEVKTAPLFDEEGKVEHVLEMTVDISQVKDLESRYHLLFERVPCFITVLDRDYRIVEANWRHRETFGSSSDRCHEVYMQSSRPCDECPVRRTFDDGRVHTQQKQVRGKNGQPVHFIVYSAPLYDRFGKIETVIEMATDITPMVEMQSKLLHAEGNAAMDRAIDVLRTTLEQLLSGFAGLSRADGALSGVQLRIEHLRCLLALMTRYGSPAPALRPVDAAALLEAVAGRVGAAVRLLTESEGTVELGELDGELLRDCVACLVYDFVELCPPRGLSSEPVLLGAGRDGDGGVAIRISRPGVELVEPGPAQAESRGLSMSLLVVKRAVERCGGRVELSSSLARGMTFSVSLPGPRRAAL